MNSIASIMTGGDGVPVPLSDVSVSAVLHDLFGEVTVSQTYRNAEYTNIEAVYTFPLPLDAVLMDLQVEIGGRVLKGVVVEKGDAEEQYEDEVEEGNLAVMLEVLEPGLYTMNIGNLLAGEMARITFSYAMLYRYSGDQLRILLPTTVAPRFGDSPHSLREAPTSALTVENQFSLQLEVHGHLCHAQFACPSHAIKLEQFADKAVISFKKSHAVMDRDFILNVKAREAIRSFAISGTDGTGIAMVASFQPFFPGLRESRALNLAVVVDCSGSMQGDSINQARRALDGILDGLGEGDYITLLAFGSGTSALSEHPLAGTASNLSKARRFSRRLVADMGGTEIGNALRETFKLVGNSGPADILLITDGEVSDWETVIFNSKNAGHRIFTVGVGSAVSEAFVCGLAAATGGMCELVSPCEGMSERIVHHFERMRAPRAKRTTIRWPAGAYGLAPSQLGAVFEGDTVIASAQFDSPPISGRIVLEIETNKGEVMRQELAMPAETITDPAGSDSAVSRLAAASRLSQLEKAEALATALRYRLISPFTNWLVIAERPNADKAEGLPALRKVPQTLAAGWGGMGAVPSTPIFARPARLDVLLCPMRAPEEMPSFLVREPIAARSLLLPEPVQRLVELLESRASFFDVESARELLFDAGIESAFQGLFEQADNLGLDTDLIAMIVLAELLTDTLAKGLSGGCQLLIASIHAKAGTASQDIRHRSPDASAFIDHVEKITREWSEPVHG